MHWLSAVLRAAAGSIVCAVLAAPPACAGTPAATGAARAGDARHDALQATLERFAQAARPGTLGVVVLDLERPARWQVNGTLPFPMMSVFKAPLGATVLDLAEQGRLPLGQRITITRDQLRGGHSPIRETFQGQQMSFTVDTLLRAAVSDSDNTAADALLRAVGGPAVVTSWLRAHGIEGMRVDMDEGEVSRIFGNLGASPAPPPAESAQQRSRRLQGGLDAYLADPRNRTTPLAAARIPAQAGRRRAAPTHRHAAPARAAAGSDAAAPAARRPAARRHVRRQVRHLADGQRHHRRVQRYRHPHLARRTPARDCRLPERLACLARRARAPVRRPGARGGERRGPLTIRAARRAGGAAGLQGR